MYGMHFVIVIVLNADGVENNAILSEALREHEISEQGASRYIHVHMFYYAC